MASALLSKLFSAHRDLTAKAVARWRDSVKAHLSGKPIDLPTLRAIGAELGMIAPEVPGTFAADCEAWQAHANAVADEQVVSKAYPATQRAAAEARKQIPILQAQLAELMDAATSGTTAAFEMSRRKQARERLEEAHPRLFAATYTGEGEVSPDPGSPSLTFDADGTAWLPT